MTGSWNDQIQWQDTTPEAAVLNQDTRSFVGEFDSYGEAQAWIAETLDHQERVGLPQGSYSVIPVRARLAGRDVR